MAVAAGLLAALLLALLPRLVLAADACRPLRSLPAYAVLAFEPAQPGVAPRLEGVLAAELTLSEGLAALGLGEATKSAPLPQAVTVHVSRRSGLALEGGQARLVFGAGDTGPAVVRREGRRFLIHVRDGKGVDANGTELAVAPLLASDQFVTLAQGSQVSLDAQGRPVAAAGSRLSWEVGGNPELEFTLLRSARLEETSGLAVGADVTVIKPARLLPGSTMKVLVNAQGFDFRARPLAFCFAVMPPGQAGLYSHSAPGRLVSESGDGAVFEVRVPPGLANAVFKNLPGRSGLGQGMLSGWTGMDASVRVMGLEGDKVVFEAAQPFVMSNFTIALVSGFVLIAALMLLSAVFVREPNPRKLLRRLALHRNQRFSLSNVQILMWTLLVLYAFCFVWVANGMLLDISSGVLVLLGISGGTSVLARAVENYAGAPVPDTAPGGGDPRFKDLVLGKDGQFDLLRFQMLGFTLFTLIYAFLSVIRSEGLPDIPQNLYLLMGISSGAYLTGKVADNVSASSTKTAGPDAAAAAAAPAAGNDFERRTSADTLKQLQGWLRVPQSGLWDEATREAVRLYKVAEGIVPADGSVNELFFERLRADPLHQA